MLYDSWSKFSKHADVFFGRFCSLGKHFLPTGSTAVELSVVEAGIGGFVINGVSAYHQEVRFSVSSAGDVNGDGFDDLIVGDPNGERSGASFVVFGKTWRDMGRSGAI